MSHLTVLDFLIVLGAGVAGATVQGSIGFGANLVAVPVVAIVAPEALPTTLILWTVPMSLAIAARERDGVEWAGVAWITVGYLPGTAIGAWLVASVATSTLSALSGGLVLVAVAASLVATVVPLNRVSRAAAGFASGMMGTASSIGGPPLALLYQHHEGRVLRGTLAIAFITGTAISIGGLAVAGAVEAWQVLLALGLVPGLLIGLALSRTVIRRLDHGWLRPAVLAFAALAGVVALLRGLT